MGAIICLIGYKVIFIGRNCTKTLILGKEEPGCLGRLEETALRCRDHSCEERDQLRRGSQHWRPLCLHGDLGAHGVPGGVPLGRLPLLEQAQPGFHMLPIQDMNNNLNMPFNKKIHCNSFAMRFLVLKGCTSHSLTSAGLKIFSSKKLSLKSK